MSRQMLGELVKGKPTDMNKRALVCFLTILPTTLFLPACKDGPVNELQLLASPTLLVQSKSNTGRYLVRWMKSINAVTYELQEDDTSSFSSPAPIYSGSDTVVFIERKPFGTTFYYRVRAINNTETSPWSETRAISIFQPAITEEFYPLQVGTTWQYECYGSSGGSHFGPWYVTVSITKDTVVANRVYSLYVSESGTLLGYAVRRLGRFDSVSGNYYEYDLENHREYLLDSTSSNAPDSIYWGNLSIVDTFPIFDVTTTERHFHANRDYTDDRYFARGFGFVYLRRIGFRFYESENLVYAIIGDNVFGSPIYEPVDRRNQQ